MAVIRNFYTRDLGSGESDSFALARDVLTDRVFVLHGQTRHDGKKHNYNEIVRGLGEFLLESGPPQLELIELIGSLVVEE